MFWVWKSFFLYLKITAYVYENIFQLQISFVEESIQFQLPYSSWSKGVLKVGYPITVIFIEWLKYWSLYDSLLPFQFFISFY